MPEVSGVFILLIIKQGFYIVKPLKVANVLYSLRNYMFYKVFTSAVLKLMSCVLFIVKFYRLKSRFVQV